MAAEAEANGAPAPVPGPPEPPEPSVAERLASAGWSVARNWQVFFAALVAWAAIWLWVSNAEPEVSAGTFSVDEYLTYATERIGWAGKAKLPRGARRRSAWLANALAALENMEANYGVIDDHEHWRAVEYLGDVQRELAMLRREYPRDVAEIVKSKPADLLVAAAADYRRALAMRSPRPGDVRRVTIGLAGALSDLGRHREVVDVLLPMVRELRRDDVDRLRREKDENEVSIADGGGEALSPFETRVHMAMAGSLRELGRPDEAERHFGFVAAGGSGAHRWLARLRLGDIAVTKALSPDRRDAAELARAIAFYRDVYSAVPPEDPKRLKAGMRLGGALLAAGDAKSAAEVFAEAAGDAAAAEVRGRRLAELMRGVSLVARAEKLEDGDERSAAFEAAAQPLVSLIRENPGDKLAAAARALLGDVRLLRGDLDGAWKVYSEMGRRWFDEAGPRRDDYPDVLPGPGDLLRSEGMVERLLALAAEYSTVRGHRAAIEVLERTLEDWSGPPALVRPKIASECDLLADALSARATTGGGDEERRRWIVRAAEEYLAIATEKPANQVHARALMIAAERFRSAGSFLRAAKAYRLFAESFRRLPAASRALYELGLCMQAVGKYREAVLAFRKNVREHPKEPYGYLSHFEWGHSLMRWGKLTGDGRDPVETPGEGRFGEPTVVRGARQVFEEILESARYTPESLSWMRALVKLGQVYVALAEGEAMRAIEDPGRTEIAEELYRRAVAVLTESLERYPIDRYRAQKETRPAFCEFLLCEEIATTEALALAHLGLQQYVEADRYLEALRGQIEEQRRRRGGEEAERLSSRQKGYYFYSGVCHYKLGVIEEDPDKAARHFEKALTVFLEARDKFLREPESPWVRHGMALCYERLGQLDAAARSYRDAAWAYRNVPEEPLAPEGLGRAFWLERNSTLRKALEWRVRLLSEKKRKM